MNSSSAVTLRAATAADRALLEGLMQFYIYDFSEFARNAADFHFNAQGAFEPYPYLNQYFSEPNCWPLLIYADGAVAGFALVNQHSHLTGGVIERNMGEFFVGRPFRRNGVATAAVHKILELHPGQWEVAVALKNAPARNFWPRAIAAAPRVSGIEQVEGDGDHWTGPIWSFKAHP
jgi:predicted acetyltransferase